MLVIWSLVSLPFLNPACISNSILCLYISLQWIWCFQTLCVSLHSKKLVTQLILCNFTLLFLYIKKSVSKCSFYLVCYIFLVMISDFLSHRKKIRMTKSGDSQLSHERNKCWHSGRFHPTGLFWPAPPGDASPSCRLYHIHSDTDGEHSDHTALIL